MTDLDRSLEKRKTELQKQISDLEDRKRRLLMLSVMPYRSLERGTIIARLNRKIVIFAKDPEPCREILLLDVVERRSRRGYAYYKCFRWRYLDDAYAEIDSKIEKIRQEIVEIERKQEAELSRKLDEISSEIYEAEKRLKHASEWVRRCSKCHTMIVFEQVSYASSERRPYCPTCRQFRGKAAPTTYDYDSRDGFPQLSQRGGYEYENTYSSQRDPELARELERRISELKQERERLNAERTAVLDRLHKFEANEFFNAHYQLRITKVRGCSVYFNDGAKVYDYVSDPLVACTKCDKEFSRSEKGCIHKQYFDRAWNADVVRWNKSYTEFVLDRELYRKLLLER